MAPIIVPPWNGPLSSSALSRVSTWQSLVRSVTQRNGTGARGVSVPLALGIIYAESRGDPNARSGASSDWFSSFGLMQVNANLHWKSTGRSLPELMIPETNVDLGTRILADAIGAKGGDVAAGVSAYNGGGGRRQPAGTKFCHVWKPGTPQAGRSVERDCARAYITRANEFGNQPYVDEVLAAARHFGYGAPVTSPPPGGINTGDIGGDMGDALKFAAVAIGSTLLMALLGRRFSW